MYRLTCIHKIWEALVEVPEHEALPRIETHSDKRPAAKA
jgi:hypothetical protein